MPSLLGELVDVLHGHQPATAEDAGAVAEPGHLGEVVGGDEDGRPAVARLADQIVDVALHERIEGRGRFVEDEDGRVVHQRLDDAHLLLLPVGHRAAALAEIALHAPGQGIDRPRRRPRSRPR